MRASQERDTVVLVLQRGDQGQAAKLCAQGVTAESGSQVGKEGVGTSITCTFNSPGPSSSLQTLRMLVK